MAGGEAFWQPLGTGIVEAVVAGDDITVDATDPANPIVSSAVDVMGAGRWEVVVSGVPAEEVTNESEDDWLYTWVGA
jgi:hypothetical protein